MNLLLLGPRDGYIGRTPAAVPAARAGKSAAILAFFSILAALSACTQAGESSASAEVSDNGGATFVDNREPTWGEDEAWSVSRDPRLTIGLLEGSSEYQLFNVSAAARQSDGDIVVANGGTSEVRLYDRDGTFIRTLGSRGGGPGEFQDPDQVLITGADSVIVWDNAHYRLTRFDSAGNFASVQSVDRGWIAKAIDPPLYPGKGELIRDGQLLVRLVEKAKDFPPGLSRSRSGALRVSMDLSRTDTLMFFGDVEQTPVSAPWGEWPVVPPLAKNTLTTVQATLARICIGDQKGPEIVCLGPAGSRTVIRWTSETAPVTEQDVATWRDTTIGLYKLKMTEADAHRVLDQVAHPTVRPHYSRILLDRIGNLWVAQAPVDWAAPEAVDYLVFDPGGVLLGTVVVPPIEVLEIGDDYAMGIYRDELEVEHLHVHEIVKRPDGN
jgi:hypothetical protein